MMNIDEDDDARMSDENTKIKRLEYCENHLRELERRINRIENILTVNEVSTGFRSADEVLKCKK